MSQTQEEPKGSSPFLVTLYDGRQIDPTTGKVVADPRRSDASLHAETSVPRVVTRRTSVDLLLPGPQMRLIAALAALDLWGLAHSDLAELFGLSEDKLKLIAGETQFQTFQKQLIRSILDSELEEVRDNIAAVARRASIRVMDMLDSDEADPKTILRAAQDILDRSGMRPVDIVEHRHTMQGGFKIVYEKAGSAIDSVKDVDFKEINNG